MSVESKALLARCQELVRETKELAVRAQVSYLYDPPRSIYDEVHHRVVELALADGRSWLALSEEEYVDYLRVIEDADDQQEPPSGLTRTQVVSARLGVETPRPTLTLIQGGADR